MQPQEEQVASSRLWIRGHATKHITEKRLFDIFSTRGEVTDVKILRKKNGTSRQFAFVGFKTAKQAKAAKEYFHGTFIDTCKIQVEYAKPPTAAEQDSNQQRPIGSRKRKLELTRKGNNQETAMEAPGFQEFLQVMKPRKNKAIWENEGSVDVFGGKNSNKKQPLGTKKDNDEPNKKKKTTDGWKREDKVHIRFDESSDSSESCQEQHEEEREKEYEDIVQQESSNLSLENLSQLTDYSNDEEWLESKLTRQPQLALSTEEENDEQDTLQDISKEALVPRRDTKTRTITTRNTTNNNSHHKNPSPSPEEDKEIELPTSSETKQSAVNSSATCDVLETGRLFVRNLSYSVTEEELTKLFEKYGALSDIHICRDSETQKPTGFAFVTFVIPENAAQALTELDGHIFQGRLLHILPAMAPNSSTRKGTSTGSLYKQEKWRKLKQSAKQGTDQKAWSTLYMSGDAVADTIAQNFQIDKSQIYQDSSSAAVQLAIGEAHLQEETRQVFQNAGVDIDALNDSHSPRSTTVILVKNLPANTLEKEIVDLFMKLGALRQVIVPPSRLIILVEFIEANDAKRAYRALAYSKFYDRPLYLEWAPRNILLESCVSNTNTTKNRIVGEQNNNLVHEILEEDETSTVLERTGATSLFVKNLDFSTTEEQLRKVFQKVAPVRSVTIAKSRVSTGTPVSLGFGFVEYTTEKDAQKALNQLQGTVVDGHALVLKLSERSGGKKITSSESSKRPSSDSHTVGNNSNKLLVRNIAFEATKKEVRKLFETFGEVKSVRLPRKLDGTHRGFGFVEFQSKRDAAQAMQSLKDTHFYGRHLVLEYSHNDEQSRQLLA